MICNLSLNKSLSTNAHRAKNYRAELWFLKYCGGKVNKNGQMEDSKFNEWVKVPK